MLDFIALKTKVNDFLQSSKKQMALNGLSLDQLYLSILHNNTELNRTLIIIADDESSAEDLYGRIRHTRRAALFLGMERNPYSGIVFSHTNQYYRFRTLSYLALETPDVVVTTFDGLQSTCPPKTFFQNNHLLLTEEDIISPNELAQKLVSLGHRRVDFIEEAGQFSIRGEIVDIFLLPDMAIRLNYFDDLIEKIHLLDIETKKTKADTVITNVLVGPTPNILSQSNYTNILRENLPIKSNYSKEILDERNEIFNKLKEGFLFDEYPMFVSSFFHESSNLFDYLNPTSSLLIASNFENNLKKYELLIEESIASFSDFNLENPLVPPINKLFKNLDFSDLDIPLVQVNELSWQHESQTQIDSIDVKFQPLTALLDKFKLDNFSSNQDMPKLQLLIEFLKIQISKKVRIIFSLKKIDSKKNILGLLETWKIKFLSPDQISFYNFYCESGFYYQNETIFIISEADIFGRKKSKSKKIRKDTDIFAEQISTLKLNDFVVHKEYGIGKYLGLENLELGGKSTDFLIIEYKDNDKVYVPVYRMDLIQKYSDSLASVSIASLKSNKFAKEKQKARESVKKLAFDLLELSAKRKLSKGFKFSAPNEYYHDFERDFPFEETPDQLQAIDDVLEDMQSEKPMDRLVCGDVGFGKTEVAMRASFKAVLDHKQVAILVPTTVLAYQHYNSFIKRFKNFPVNIEFLSRFKSPKESSEILSKLSQGTVDIVIGTHKLLADKIKFHDLGLLIIDEEQRFGVGHKEKIKNLKSNIDCLTMTATPIPRTLQMSFLGIRDLSLIRTAPPKKQSVKTYIVKDNLGTYKQAIDTELSRGGQVFIVHNKVVDIEQFTHKIREIVPYAKIVFAHGQLPERELEKRIKDFYDKKYDILVSTTIIESGIDIPTANTMIIDRADHYGLAQLHQLRGRIGRSDKKAYAYLSIPAHKLISEIAAKRLKTLQTYADMGAGFSISSVDLEIRGSGDLLGAEQSGHIQNIGLELYMDLLEETMNEIKGRKEDEKIHQMEIQTPFAAFIPNDYINNSAWRLKYYKRLSSAKSMDTLSDLKSELTDIYGIYPQELENLFVVLEAKINLQTLPISSIKVMNKNVLLQFDEKILASDSEIRDRIVNFFISRPKVYKLNPDFSVKCSFKDIVDKGTFLDFSKHIAQHI